MKSSTQCEHARAVLAKIESLDDGEALTSLIAHIDGCEDCRKDPSFAEAFHRITIATEDLRAVDQVLAEQEADERSMAESVIPLLESLSGLAAELGRSLATRHGAYSLYAAQEAFSSTIRRRARRKRPRQGIELDKDDFSIRFDDVQVLDRHELALEISRFADLWTEDETQPSSDAESYVYWIALTLTQQSRLLRDFEAYETHRGFWLRPLSANERHDDPYLRWSKSTSKELMSFVTNRHGEVFLLDDQYSIAVDDRHAELDFVVVALEAADARAMNAWAGAELRTGTLKMRRLNVGHSLHIDGEDVVLARGLTEIGGLRVAGSLKATPE
jgi:hypothetical protein